MDMLDLNAFVPKARFQPGVSLSPDAGEVAYASNSSGRFALWVAPVRGGAPRCVAEFPDQAVRQVAWAPDGKSLVFTADHDGDEQFQIYRAPAEGGTPERLTTVDDRQHRLALDPYDPHGRYLIYAANDRDESVHDLVVLDLHDGTEHRHVPIGKASFQPVSVSPDGRWLLIEGFSSNIDSDCYLLDLSTPNAQPTRVTDGDAQFEPLGWASDSTGFVLLTTAWGEFTAGACYSMEDKLLKPIVIADWDVETVHETFGKLLWVVNENGRSALHSRRGDAEPTRLSLPHGVINALDIARDGSVAALLLETTTRPAEIVILDLATGAHTYLTDTRPPGLTAVEAIEPKTVAFTTRDGRAVHGLLYRPHGDGPFPLVMWIHGGPEAQERFTYERAGLYQYLLDQGIAIYAPNAAGSTGYGLEFRKLLYRDWGGVDLRDFEDATVHLKSVDWVDSNRLAVAGASYGGFGALSCLTRLPGLWTAGVSLCGPSNLVTLAAACPPTWREFVNIVLGDPVADVELLTRRSPVAYVDQLTAPLMVVQGARDPRVPKAEADQIVDKLRSRDVDVRYIVYPDEGHGFTNRDNEIDAYTQVGDFLIAHLKPTTH
ncbi:S9 family peptidase [Actinomadura sp. DC4]|uniref:S9 family peptidase n=1 Tax=Actinomadura sp. DC4 TaxID=3055069 RepID=UPI0025B01FDF|nr:S9 family peptidase [Actinomadura sp. DC4]MDN3359289.1 S9 family peptidase [Actinomadura sp. DC4]